MNAPQTSFHSVRYRTNVITWSDLYELDHLQRDLAGTEDDEADLYALVEVRGSSYRVIYVGIAYDQTVTKRFRNHHIIQELYFRRRHAEVLLMTGQLRKRRSRAETAEVEALLIHRAQPLLNKRGRKSNPGGNLVVVNRDAEGILRERYAGSRGAMNRWRFYGGAKRAA